MICIFQHAEYDIHFRTRYRLFGCFGYLVVCFTVFIILEL